MWPSPRARLLKNKCSRIEINQEKIYYLLGKGTETITSFCQDNIRDTSRKPTTKSESKGESIVEYKLGDFQRLRCP